MGRVLTRRIPIGGSFTRRWSDFMVEEKMKEMGESSPKRIEVTELKEKEMGENSPNRSKMTEVKINK